MNCTIRVKSVVTDPTRYEVDSESGCWIWKGAKLASGHGVVKICGHARSAHRTFYSYFNGRIPNGYQVHHVCHRPDCVNPGHLLAVTPGEHARIHGKLSFDVADKMRSLYAQG